MQDKFKTQFNFLDEDDLFLQQVSEQITRGKAKTDYRRRESLNETTTNQQQQQPQETNTVLKVNEAPKMLTGQGHEVIVEQDVEETEKDA